MALGNAHLLGQPGKSVGASRYRQRNHVVRRQIIAVWPRIAGAAAMASTVHHDDGRAEGAKGRRRGVERRGYPRPRDVPPNRVGKIFAFAANTVTSGVKGGLENYEAYSATPKGYDAFVAQISKMWASQPNWTDAQLKAIAAPVLVVHGDHDEAIKREHTEIHRFNHPARRTADPTPAQAISPSYRTLNFSTTRFYTSRATSILNISHSLVRRLQSVMPPVQRL
jgi:pimeloyl-ACP methyl ester carboxylesterase